MAKVIVCNMKNADIDPTKYEKSINNINLDDVKLILCPKDENIKYFKSDNYDLCMQDIKYDINNNIKYVIVGHSYRRKKYKETNKVINSKIRFAINNNLKVILCIGENKLINKLGLTNYYLKWQIKSALEGTNLNENIIIAYEPVYSIGKTSIKSNSLNDRYNYIKKVVNSNTLVIYGGGVNEKNIKEIVDICDGVMLGESCFDPHNLEKILKKFTK